MKETTPVRVVELPEFEDIKGEEVGETLCNLFTYLIPEKFPKPLDVDPRQIKLNFEDCKELIGSIQEELDKDKELKVNLLWLNQEPAGDKEVPRSKIYLYEGYMKPANNNEKVG